MYTIFLVMYSSLLYNTYRKALTFVILEYGKEEHERNGKKKRNAENAFG